MALFYILINMYYSLSEITYVNWRIQREIFLKRKYYINNYIIILPFIELEIEAEIIKEENEVKVESLKEVF